MLIKGKMLSGLKHKWSVNQLPGIQVYLDANSVSLEESGNYGFVDHSGNSHHYFQTNTANRPTHNQTGLNGKPAFSFNGSSSYLTCTNLTGLLNDVGAACFYVVGQKPTTNQNGAASLFVSNTNNSGNTKAALTHGGGDNFAFFGRRLDSDTAINNQTDRLLQANVPFIYGAILDYQNANIKIRFNRSTLVNTSFQTSGNTSPGNPLLSYVGRSSGGVYYSGLISSIIVAHTANLEQIYQLENFLYSRWNL